MRISQFHVADAALLGSRGLVELKKQLQAGQSPSVLSKMLEDLEQIFSVSGSTFEQWM
jgi:hypothetical protein